MLRIKASVITMILTKLTIYTLIMKTMPGKRKANSNANSIDAGASCQRKPPLAAAL